MEQTHSPCEIVLVKDGPLEAQVDAYIEAFQKQHPDLVRILSLPCHEGLASAMRQGVLECGCEWIARMDADDISSKRRCELELRYALANDADIVGCDCEEFVDSVDEPVAIRAFPEHHEDIVEFSRRRTPFCHPAVMMRKSAVLQAGNYQEIQYLEDYDLFVRMLRCGARGYTVKQHLYHVRVGQDFYSRRGGLAYVKALLRFNRVLLKNGWMSPADYLIRSAGNLIVGLSPGSFRAFIYQGFLRK